MTMTISGSGTITGLSAGGLPSASITQANVATPLAGTGPAFSAYGSAFNSAASGTYTKIAYNTELFDTNSNYDTTLYRFTPTVAGYYQISGILSCAAASGITAFILYKNGSAFTYGNQFLNSGGTILNLNTICYANGTTDYFELYAVQTSGISANIGSNATYYCFSGALVRAA